MKNEDIINNLTEFWEKVGALNNILKLEKKFKWVGRESKAWPNLIFGINPSINSLDLLKQKMESGILPKTLSIPENKKLENKLALNGFKLKSSVTSMCWNGKWFPNWSNYNLHAVIPVTTEVHVWEFSAIAANAFGYNITSETIAPLLHTKSNVKMFIQRHKGSWCSCGLVFKDSNGIAGIHMIGTKPQYQGQGLGKLMTLKLFEEALKLNNEKIVLVASVEGAKIYTKMGFTSIGYLKSYTI